MWMEERVGRGGKRIIGGEGKRKITPMRIYIQQNSLKYHLQFKNRMPEAGGKERKPHYKAPEKSSARPANNVSAKGSAGGKGARSQREESQGMNGLERRLTGGDGRVKSSIIRGKITEPL